MTILHFDGFGAFQTGSKNESGTPATPAQDLSLRYSSYGTNVDVGRLESGSQGIRNFIASSGSTVSPDLQVQLPGNYNPITVGMYFHYNQAIGWYCTLASFLAGSGFMGALGVQSDGTIAYGVGEASNQPRLVDSYPFTSSVLLTRGNWYYIECQVYINNTTGWLNLWVNGQSAGSYTNVDTQNDAGPISKIKFAPDVYFGESTNNEWDPENKMTDIYIGTGSNMPLGPSKVWFQPADRAGSSSLFTPSAGNNEDNVDEDGYDVTTYNESPASGVGNRDSFQIGAQIDSGLSGPILAMQAIAVGTATTGSAGVRAGIISDVAGTPTVSSGSGVGLTSGSWVGFFGNIEEVDPDTGAAWVLANANAAEVYYEHSSSV